MGFPGKSYLPSHLSWALICSLSVSHRWLRVSRQTNKRLRKVGRGNQRPLRALFMASSIGRGPLWISACHGYRLNLKGHNLALKEAAEILLGFISGGSILFRFQVFFTDARDDGTGWARKSSHPSPAFYDNACDSDPLQPISFMTNR